MICTLVKIAFLTAARMLCLTLESVIPTPPLIPTVQIGDYYADRQKWDKAFTFYTKGKNIPALVQCAYALEDYASLEQFMHQARVGQMQSTMAPPHT
jgi:hypothetical protein